MPFAVQGGDKVTNYTAVDLQKLLSANPDIRVDGVNVVADELGWHTVVGPKLSEREMQAAVITECDLRAITNADYGMIAAIPNGQYRPGQRMEPGLRPGFPDLILPIARHGRNGLALELKVGNNKCSAEQLRWHRDLRVRNWAVEVIYDDPQRAIDLITWYLEK